MALVIIEALVPIFFILFLGYFAGKIKLVDNTNVALLNIFVMDFALPAAMFSATVQVPREVIISEIPLLLVLTLSMWVIYAIIYYVVHSIYKRSMQESAVIALTVALPNYAALGLPVLERVLGQSPGTALNVAIAIACGSVLMTPIALMLLEAGKPENEGKSVLGNLPQLILKSFKKPLVYCPIVGIILALIGIKLPQIVFVALKPLAISAAGAALFLTGVILSARKLKLTSLIILNLILVNIVQGFVGLAFVYAFGMTGDSAKAAILLIALAAGFFGIVFGNRYGVKSSDAEGTLLLSSLLSIITIPLFIYIANSLF
jgi:malonate transporter